MPVVAFCAPSHVNGRKGRHAGLKGYAGIINTYKGLWLGMGHNDNGIVSNPSSQFKYFSRPPRINEKIYRQLQFELGCVLDSLKEENYDDDGDDDDIDGDNDGAIASLINQRRQSQLEEVTNLGVFLDELVKGKKTMAETERIITAALNETIRNAERKRNSALKKLLSTTAGCNFDETNDESVSSPTELSMKLAPFLFLYKIPLQPDVLSLLLKEIMQVSKTLHQKDVLTFTMWNGKSTTIVPVSKCNTLKMFKRQKMELKLQEYGIDRPTYHGGDLTGVKVKVLFQNVDVIMAEFKLICDECEEKGATDEEVDEMVGRYSHLGSLLDGVFSIARMPCGTVTLEDERLLERMIKAVMQMWRGLRLSMLGPKIHGLEDHLLDQVKRYKGIGDFAEDFVEQSHQFGVKDELRTRSMSRNRAFMSHVSWEYMSQNSAVLIAKDKMNNAIKKRKRKRRVELEQSKEERDRIRIEKLDAIERGEYELMIDDYAKQTTE